MIYKKDIEDITEQWPNIATRASLLMRALMFPIIYNFNNLVVVVECHKVKRSHDNYDGVGPSREESTDDVPYPERTKRLPEFMAHGNCGHGFKSRIRMANSIRN